LIHAGTTTPGVDRERLTATVGGFLVAAAVFAVMFYLVDAREVVAEARSADLALLGAVAALILLWNVAWGVELWTVLQALDVDAPVGTALLVNAAGAFANHVTPFGQAGGEPVTAWLLTQSAETDYEVSLASIASLDAINVVPSTTFAVVGALYYVVTVPRLPAQLDGLPTAIAVGVAAVAVVAVLAYAFREDVGRAGAGVAYRVVHGVSERVPRVSPPSRAAVMERIRGFTGAIGRVAGDRERLTAAVGLSSLGWGFQAIGLWVTFLALGASIPFYVPFFVLPLGTLGSALPTPGGLGGTEAINVSALTVVTAVAPSTIAAAVTIHSVGGYLLTTSVGAAAASVLGVQGRRDTA
jgi:uncharacterized protein (TIRG00374 family)